jgi:hypothetical protein
VIRRRGDRKVFSLHEDINKCVFIVIRRLSEEAIKIFLEDMWVGKGVKTKCFSTRCAGLKGWS